MGGSSAQNVYNKGGVNADFINDRGQVGQNNGVSQALQGYGSGQMSYADALKSAQGAVGGEGGHNDFQKAYAQDMFNTGSAGVRQASENVQSNPLLKGLFGEGGQMNQAEDQATKLSNQGFQLTPEDHEAYGQASGNIARLFGSQEQNLSQSLADRGLASAPSGAAGSSFTGLQGNKNEQLANAQMQIANQRMQNTMQRLSDTRNFISSMGGQAEKAVNDQYSAQQDPFKQQQAIAGSDAKRQEDQQGQENKAWDQNQSSSFNPMNLVSAGAGALTGGLTSGLSSGLSGLTSGLFNSKPAQNNGLPGLQGGMPLSGGR